MACTLDTYSLVTLDDIKAFLRLSYGDLTANAFGVYHDESSSATAATVTLTGTTLALVITGGGNAGTDSLDLTAAANDTVGELTAVIDALGKGWFAVQHCRDDVLSSDLNIFTNDAGAAVDAFGPEKIQTITFQNNCYLHNLANMVTDAIQTLADREFASRTRTETRDSLLSGMVQTRNFPITSIDWVATGTQRAIKISNTDSGAALATVSINRDAAPSSTEESPTDTMELVIVGGANAGSDSVTLSSSVTITAAVATINALGKGWTATVETGGNSNMGAFPTDYLLEAGGLNCLSQDVWVSVPSKQINRMWTNLKRGQFRVLWGGIPVIYKYTAGFLPDDIKLLALEAIKLQWGAKDQDGGLKREKLGDYEYERFAVQQSISSSPAFMARIAPYRNDIY